MSGRHGQAELPGCELGRDDTGHWPVLVTDGEQRAALAVVRALGAAGYPVYVCSDRRRSLAGASRYARREEAVPSPLAEPARFVSAVSRLMQRWQIKLLLPVADPSLLALLPWRESFDGVVIPFPDVETYRRVSDKSLVLDTAAALGLATPRQRVIASPEAGATLDVGMLTLPLVLKPARSIAETNGARVKLGVTYAASPEELRSRLRALPPAAYPVLLQERIVGLGIGIFLLRWGGSTAAVFAHRRLREKPPSGGVSVSRESIAADPELVAQSEALLEHFGWEGVAMVEYKLEAATGTPYLMEVNGRFWGSLQLAVDAGVNFPVLLASAATGRPHPVVPRYRTGVRSRWWWGDLDVVLSRLRRSSASLALPPDAPTRWRMLLEFLKLWRPGEKNEVLRWRDPLPFVRETLEWFRGIGTADP